MMNGPEGFHGPVNLGNPGEFTVKELAELTVKLAGSRSEIRQVKPLPEDDPARRRPDISLAKAKLGWEPKIPLEQGLAKTIEFFRSIDLGAYRPPTPNY